MLKFTYEHISKQLKKYDESQIKNLLGNSENPVTISYISKFSNDLVTIPIWTYFFESKYYCFASRKSKKVQSIEIGNTDVSLLIINRQYYPHPESNIIPYLGIRGEVKLSFHSDNPKIAWIHQELLLKYDPKLSQGWIKELYNKIELKPEEDWLIEITPQHYYTG